MCVTPRFLHPATRFVIRLGSSAPRGIWNGSTPVPPPASPPDVAWMSMYKYSPTPTVSLNASARCRPSLPTICWVTRNSGTMRRLSRMYGRLAMPSGVPVAVGTSRRPGQPTLPSGRGASVWSQYSTLSACCLARFRFFAASSGSTARSGPRL